MSIIAPQRTAGPRRVADFQILGPGRAEPTTVGPAQRQETPTNPPAEPNRSVEGALREFGFGLLNDARDALGGRMRDELGSGQQQQGQRRARPQVQTNQNTTATEMTAGFSFGQVIAVGAGAAILGVFLNAALS
jgi:hypothetical protein